MNKNKCYYFKPVTKEAKELLKQRYSPLRSNSLQDKIQHRIISKNHWASSQHAFEIAQEVVKLLKELEKEEDEK